MADPCDEPRERVIELAPGRVARLAVLLLAPVIVALAVADSIREAYYGPTRRRMQLTVEKQAYRPGEEVRIYVKITSSILGILWETPVGGAPVGVEVRGRDGSLVYVDQGATDAQGLAEFFFKLPGNALNTEYVVHAASPGVSWEEAFGVTRE